ncbi:MAG: MFS transporter [Candidatus Heimdallarchaeota archaeon]
MLGLLTTTDKLSENQVEEVLSNEDSFEEHSSDESENQAENTSDKPQRKLFWLLSIGSNTSQLILLNFFPYFAAEVGVTSTVMGFLTAIRNLVGALFQGRIGLWSDKKGRRLFLLLGFFLSFAFTVMLIFSYSAIMLAIVATAQAFAFSIIIPAWNAALGDVTKLKGRTTFIGKLSAIGQLVGIILMLVLAGIFFFFDRFNGYIVWGKLITSLDWKLQYGIVFAVCALTLFISGIAVIFLRETRKEDPSRVQPKMRTAFQNKSFRNFIIVNSFFGISMAALWPIYPVIQVSIMGLEIYELTIVAAVYVIFFSFGSFLGGKLGDRFGRKPVLIFSRVIMFSVSLLYIPAVLSGSWYYIMLTNVISGFGNGIFLVLMNAYALDLSSAETLGAFSGLAQASWGIATFIGSLSAGFIADAINSAYGPIIMVVSTTIAIAIMRVLASVGYFFIEESLPKENRTSKTTN